jgi:TusA-related sulfurtransferase
VSIDARERRCPSPAPAAKAALDEAGPGFEDLHAVTAHNPFAVNDLWPDPTEPAG